MTDALWLDVRYAARSLRKRPALIAIAILVTALGIGSVTAVITHRLWMDAFQGDRNVIGRVVSVDGSPYAIRGVLAENFQFPRSDASYYTKPVDLLIPAASYPGFPANAQQWFGIVRLKAGVPISQAQQELDAVARRLEGVSEGASDATSAAKRAPLRLTPLADATAHTSRAALLVTLGIAIVLLMVAASNVMNLLFSRGATRLHEMAIRQAMGSTMQRIVRQLLCESGIVVLGGAALGIAMAGFVTAVTVLASFIPARRASLVSPTAALRYD